MQERALQLIGEGDSPGYGIDSSTQQRGLQQQFHAYRFPVGSQEGKLAS